MGKLLSGGKVLLSDDPRWYCDAIIYELHVRAFADSTGDGVGDFRGLVGKLDYLQDLGVTALWLLPFYPSPLRDDGYDIADYTDVHPAYGTLADFKAFLREAHRRGLRIITELVLNHTSDQHAWFQRARRAPAGSPERDFYVWSDTPRKYPEARIIFKDFESSNWAWDPVAGAYYWHRFYAHQPDLNYDNPEVHRATFEVLDFWLGLGVDGLRLDAVPYLYEREGTHCENLPETHAYLKQLRRHVDERFPHRMLLAEANQWPEDAAAYFGQGDECHMNFHFPLMPRLFMAMRTEDRLPIVDILQQTPPIPEGCQWALFLRNHDELTLEMVTDEDRDYMYRHYAQDPQMRINLGIRRRLAPLLENHRGRIELANGLLLSMPGTPVIYYGDEIGMGDNIYLGDRNGVRTPMQWSPDRNAGFSSANPQRLYLPVSIDPGCHYEAINVEAQQKNPSSLLWWMKRLIALRRRRRAFGRGSLEFLPSNNSKVLAFVRRLPATSRSEHRGASSEYPGTGSADSPSAILDSRSADEIVLVVANLSRHPQYVELDLGAFEGRVPVELLGRTKFPPVGPQPYFFTLGSYDFYWFSLEHQTAELPDPSPREELRTLAVTGSWEKVFQAPAREALAEALLAYLRRCRWFRARPCAVEGVEIVETMPMLSTSRAAHLTLLRLAYTEGEPETYVLPVAFAQGKDAERLQGEVQGVIARLHVWQRGAAGADGGPTGLLYDPLGEKDFARALLESIHRQRRFRRAGAELSALALPALHQNAAGTLEPSLLAGEQSYTSVVYGDQLVLKFFRRVEAGVNPELEVGRFLAERTSFRHAAPVAGALEYRNGHGEEMTLAVLHGFVPSQGDAWHFIRDALGRYYEQALTRQAVEQAPDLPTAPLVELAGREVPPVARELLGSHLEEVRLLGQRTAEFHMALASTPDAPAFAPEPFTVLYQRSLYQSLRSHLRQTLEFLRRSLPSLPDRVRQEGRKLLDREEELLRQARRILERRIHALRTRCHGDYHLGQVLYTGKDFVLLDLEGGGDRPLNDLRRKRSPLRDVATMFRSFHYVAFAASRRESVRPEDLPALEPWMRFWRLWAAVVFLKAYLPGADGGGFLPRERQDLQTLLDCYLMKRAAHELRFDLTHRPERAEVPLLGLWETLEESGRRGTSGP